MPPIPDGLRRNPNPEHTMTQHDKKPATKRLSGIARVRREILDEIAKIDEKVHALTELQARKAALQSALSELPE
jgi:hypothetical protein